MIKRLVARLLTLLKSLPQKLRGFILTSYKLELLTKKQTEVYLESYQLANNPATQVFLPGVHNQAEPTKLIFTPSIAETFHSYVWAYTPKTNNAFQLPYGGIVADGKILCPDFESYHLVKNFLTSEKRTVLDHKTIIAPWSHYLDGIAFGGYYDFVILVAAKLCRIKEALPKQIYTESVVAYPLFKTAYEQEYLSLIGIEAERILDSRVYAIRFDRCVLANSGHWFYPDPDDVLALKKQLEEKLKIERTRQDRIYISRSSRRKVVNESTLLSLLKKYDFTIIEDKPRSVAEQVAIYKNASFIMGPHGASFTNIIWCEPGTHLFELFPPNLIVDHFAYLAQVMGMSYSAYSHVIKMGHTKYHIEEDIFVSIADLEKSLNDLLVKV